MKNCLCLFVSLSNFVNTSLCEFGRYVCASGIVCVCVCVVVFALFLACEFGRYVSMSWLLSSLFVFVFVCVIVFFFVFVFAFFLLFSESLADMSE